MEVEFHLETNESIVAERALAVVSALVAAIRNHPDFPEDGEVEIAHLGRGSLRSKILIWSAVAAIGSFGLDLKKELLNPESDLAKCTAETMVDDGVTKAWIRCEGTFEVLRDEMPAVAALVKKREAELPPEAVLQSGDHGARKKPASPDRTVPGPASMAAPPTSASSTFVGTLTGSHDELEFELQSGAKALVDDVADGLVIPHDELIEIDAQVRRGERGGMADPRLLILDWRPAPAAEPTSLEQLATSASGSRELVLEGWVYYRGDDWVIRTTSDQFYAIDPAYDGSIPEGPEVTIVAIETDRFTESGLPIIEVTSVNWAA